MGQQESTGQRWAYLGPEGTFTEQAARALAGRLPWRRHPRPGRIRVRWPWTRCGSARADAACVAMESSVEGAVPVTQDELTHGDPLLITAEAYVPVTFDLLVRPGYRPGRDPHRGRAPARARPDPGLAGRDPAGRRGGDDGVERRRRPRRWPRASWTPPRPRRWPAPATGWITLVADIGEVRDAVTRFVLLQRPGRRRRRPGTTARRWCCPSATTRAPCWRCSASSPPAGST